MGDEGESSDVRGAERRALDEFISERQIRESVVRYCRAVDRNERDAIAAEYHPDGVDDHGLGAEVPGEQWADACMLRDRTRAYVHHLGQSLIEVFGDDAFAETYWVAYQAWTEGERRYLRTRGGRYADWFQRREGVWKVFVRRVVDDWSKVEEVDRVIEDASVHAAAPYPDDPTYLLRRQIIESAHRA